MQQMLEIAIQTNNTEEFKEHLKTATATEKAHAAHWAAYVNNIEMLQELIKQDADISQADKEGGTCLHWGVQHNNLDMIKLLLSCGAKNQEDNNGITPAHIAEKNNFDDIFQSLAQHFLIEPFKKPKEQNEFVGENAIFEKYKISADTL